MVAIDADGLVVKRPGKTLRLGREGGGLAAAILIAFAAFGAPAMPALSAPGVGSSSAPPLNAAELLWYGPQADAQGIKFGSFIVFPSVAFSGVHDSNVFAAAGRQRDDVALRMEGEVSAVTNWSRHSLQMYLRGAGDFHDDFTSENAGRFGAGASAQIDVYRQTWIRAFVDVSLAPEERGTGESFFDFNRQIDTQDVRYGGLIHQGFNRVWVEAGASSRFEGFDDVTRRGSGGQSAVVVDQDFRDGTAYEVFGRLGYEFSPLTSVFVETSYNERDYTGGLFDSDGYKIVGGLRYQFSVLTLGEFTAGYLHQDLSTPLQGDAIDTLTYRGSLHWQVTPLIALAMIGSRDVGSPSMFDGAANRMVSDVGVRADYAIWRDLTLSAGLAYDWTEYLGTGRSGNRYRASLGAQYYLNIYTSLFAKYEYSEFDSRSSAAALAAFDYSRSIGIAGVRLRY